MWRFSIIQDLIFKINASNYLEIGVSDARIIKKLKVKHKYGVDPYFNFSKIDRIKFRFKALNFRAFNVTSDEFFLNIPEKLKKNGVDIAFIDGLHTYKQTLKDIENTLPILNENGIIIVHDCSPQTFAGAYPVKDSIDEVYEKVKNGELPDWDGNWNGDTWKAIVHLRIERNDLEIFTMDTDWGVGIIRRGKPNQLKDITIEQLQDLDFSYLKLNKTALLNLKQPEYFTDFLIQYNSKSIPFRYQKLGIKARIIASKLKKRILN